MMVEEKEYKELIKYKIQQVGNVIMESTLHKAGTCCMCSFTENVRLTKDVNFYTLSEIVEGKKEYIMDDCPLMRNLYSNTFQNFRGDILVGGLGIGLMFYYIKSYHSIDIVEKNKDVIKIIEPYYRELGNVHIIEGDMWDFTPTKKYDFVYEDFLWEDTKEKQRAQFDLKFLPFADKIVHLEF